MATLLYEMIAANQQAGDNQLSITKKRVNALSARCECYLQEGANIDPSTAESRLFFGFFASLAEYERSLIAKRTRAGPCRGHEGTSCQTS